jgi:hypothetical protein
MINPFLTQLPTSNRKKKEKKKKKKEQLISYFSCPLK